MKIDKNFFFFFFFKKVSVIKRETYKCQCFSNSLKNREETWFVEKRQHHVNEYVQRTLLKSPLYILTKWACRGINQLSCKLLSA